VIRFHRLLTLAAACSLSIAACSPPTPTASTAPPPPPPPEPVVQKPAPPPPAPEPDPYEVAMQDVSKILKRYSALYTEIRDEKTAQKAAGEIEQMKSRLRELAVQISKIPPKPSHEKMTLAFQTELTQMQTATLNNPDMQRVLADPDLQLQFIAAHSSFVTEGLLPLGQAIASRQSPQLEPPQPAEAKAKP
jgi:hypothetical protein